VSSAAILPAHPENILKALGKLWTSLGEEEHQHGAPTVLRACAMTLIVATEEAGGSYSASQIISELMREHPSRGIVLAISGEAEQPFQAQVLAQCWKPFGKAQQICCEQIEITVHPDNWVNVGPTLVGLTAADLPVIFWCRYKAALSADASEDQRAGLQTVLNLSTKVIVDTFGDDAPSAFDLISRMRVGGRVVADLEWARLTPWRQPIAQIFENPARTNKYSDFHTVEITHCDDEPGPSAYYAAGWFSSVRKAKVSFIKTDGGFGPGLHGIRLISDSETIAFERTACDCMRLSSTNGRERAYSFQESNLYSLMHEELSVPGFDPYFDAAFARAQEILRER